MGLDRGTRIYSFALYLTEGIQIAISSFCKYYYSIIISIFIFFFFPFFFHTLTDKMASNIKIALIQLYSKVSLLLPPFLPLGHYQQPLLLLAFNILLYTPDTED